MGIIFGIICACFAGIAALLRRQPSAEAVDMTIVEVNNLLRGSNDPPSRQDVADDAYDLHRQQRLKTPRKYRRRIIRARLEEGGMYGDLRRQAFKDASSVFCKSKFNKMGALFKFVFIDTSKIITSDSFCIEPDRIKLFCKWPVILRRY